MKHRLVAMAAVSTAALFVSACGKTTYDAALVSTTAPVTSTTLPRGTVADLLPHMVAEVGALSTRIANFRGEGATATLIERYWAAIKDEISRTHPDLVDDFSFIVRRCRQAADRHRPADADRAYRNIVELQKSILGTPLLPTTTEFTSNSVSSGA